MNEAEYYVLVTHRCNLSCSYCSARAIMSADGPKILGDSQAEAILKYISKNNPNGSSTVVFFGGEPLLEPKVIDSFVRQASDRSLDLTYILYTNGLLLNEVPLHTLKAMNTIFISLDGDRQSHEKHRGPGTYKRILSNLEEVRPKMDSYLIGRITVEEETDLYKSATSILDRVDAVFWQVVSKPRFTDPNSFVARYKQGLGKLFELWLTGLRQREVLNLVPFQAVASSLVFGVGGNGRSFRCGAGSFLQVIDVDGCIYWCDEYLGDSRGIVGHVSDGRPPDLRYSSHTELFSDCRNCEVSNICLGGCKKCLLEYSDEQKRIYCNLIKSLIRLVRDHAEEIHSLVEEHGYTLRDLYGTPRCTEEIP